VIVAEPNYIRSIVASPPPNDPFWLDNTLWGLQKIQAQQTWNTYTTGDGAVVIADIDTGVRYTHPDLVANMWTNPGEIPGNLVDDDSNGYVDDIRGIDTLNHDSNPMDDNGHGTHTAGTFGAVGNNATGVVGVNWNVKILACKFLNSAGNGTDAGAIECFNYIVALKRRGINIRVSNNSWGGGPFSQPLKDAIDAAGAENILNVFAAGNGGADQVGDNNDLTPHYPSSFDSPSIVAVAASNTADSRASFSNYGAASVDLAAPGVQITSTFFVGNNANYKSLNGTSMAAPHVAGAAALLLAQNPNVPVAGLKSLLLDNVTPLQQWSGIVATGGRLNVFQAANALAANAPPAISLIAPVNGATFAAATTIALTATASDTNGAVSNVEFFADGLSIGTDTTAPYTIAWSGAASGSHALTAVATDNLGATSTSSVVTITVTPVDEAAVTLSVTRGSTRVQSLQNTDGGWYFQVGVNGCGLGTGISCPNTFGITGLGLLVGYQRTGDLTALAGATLAGDALVARYTAHPSSLPYGQDVEFLVALAAVTVDPLKKQQYLNTATGWFQRLVTQYPNPASKVDEMIAGRHEQGLRSAAAWDAASLIRAAKATGFGEYALGAAARIRDQEPQWKDTDPAHRWDQCDTGACGPADNPLAHDLTLLGEGSLLWAMHDLPGFDPQIAEYRSFLVAQQDASGAWDAGNLQITAYVVLGLSAVGGTGVEASVTRAVAFVLDNQLPEGGWPLYVTSAGATPVEYTEIDAEVVRAMATLFSTPTGSGVSVSPSQVGEVTFASVTAPGVTTMTAIDPSALGAAANGFHPHGRITYDVDSTATFTGAVTVCLRLIWITDAATFNAARILHAESGLLVDRTILNDPLAPDFATRRMCARTTSLSPFAVGLPDTAPPNLSVTLTPVVLWPADRKLVTITANISVSDDRDPAPAVALVSIASSEPDTATESGDAGGDIQDAAFGTDDRTFVLRAERAGKGSGRTYTVVYRATDKSGKSREVTTTVMVPRNK